MKELTLGSLFDGSGGFPLAASLCGITPVFASEIEPYPIAVTTSKFPNMHHYGDVSKISGAEIEPVDVITFGSPCQDLSVAGLRKGLKHEANGDDETTRSGLFMEAVRIIKEMRRATNGEYPKYAIWENVPGAFSSNKGEDFRIVLEELIKICEPSAVMPPVPKNGWAYADSYVGDGWSLAYRVFDAQYWGVPQRRRRIYLVLDLTDGIGAGKVLFECEGVRGYFTEGRTPWQGTAANFEGGSGTADREGEGKSGSLIQPICVKCYDGRGNGDGETVNTLTGDHNNRITDYSTLVCSGHPVYCLQGSMIGRADKNGPQGDGTNEGVSFTLNTIDRHAVAYCIGNGQLNQITMSEQANTLDCMHDQQAVVVFDKEVYNSGQNATGGHYIAESGPSPSLRTKHPPGVAVHYIVRRLTPTECARLQGFPDRWGDIPQKDTLTDEEYSFWLDVRNTHAAINGRTTKEYTKEQMLKWYNNLHSDSFEYKMWGNGIALPNALYVMQGIEYMLRREDYDH